jgi:hypothetical protein
MTETLTRNAPIIAGAADCSNPEAAALNVNPLIGESAADFQQRMSKSIIELIDKKVAEGKIKIGCLQVNEKGHIIVDKDKDPELYDWAVNG